MARRPRRIGLMLDLEWSYKRHADVFAGTQRYAEEQGWHSSIDEFAHSTLAERSRKDNPYDGIIARVNHALLHLAKRRRIPLVNVWANSPVQDQVAGVSPDFEAVGRECAEHLLARGLNNFATLIPPGFAHEQSRRVFAECVRQAGFNCSAEKCLQSTGLNLASWRKTNQLLQECIGRWKWPIGVYVAYDNLGRMVAQVCHERGLRVPEDVAIIAGQNEVTLCEHPRPSLTSMEMGYEKVGYEAARLLHALMDGKAAPRAPLLIAPTGIVVRESTDFHAVDNELVAAALTFISANCQRSIGQDDVAQAVGAETRTLQNRFRKFLGRPIVAEIRRVRIERAKRELAQSDRSIKEIARRVGFGESMRMYEVFRRELGITPSEYRAERQLENGS